MKGISLLKSLVRLAGSEGRPYAEAFVRVLIEEGDYKAADELRELIKTLPPHEGVSSDLEPSRSHKRAER